MIFGHQLALVRLGSRDEQVDTRPDYLGIAFGESYLLTHDRCQVAVEGEEEWLQCAALSYTFRGQR